MTLTEKIHKNIGNLPTLPTVYSALSDAMANPRSTNQDIAKIISTDQAASFKVLKVVNSPFYGFSGRIDTISQAVLHLGFTEIRNMVMALSIINLFSKKTLFENFRPVDFWAHSIAVGVATRLLGKAAGVTNLENYFLAGILHDIGKLLFVEVIEAEYEQVLKVVSEQRCSLREAEKEVIKLDHTDAGRIMAKMWKLPTSLWNAITYHHEGMVDSKPEMLVACVHIGNIFSRMLELGYPGDDYVEQPNEKVWEFLKLPPRTFTSIFDTMMNNYEETTALMLSK